MHFLLKMVIFQPATGVFPKIGVPQHGWFIMEDPIEMDDLGVPLFSETSMLVYQRLNMIKLSHFVGSLSQLRIASCSATHGKVCSLAKV